MRQVVVLSGKGGTGKTSVTASLAHLASRQNRIVLVDADVDASNLGILLRPDVRRSHRFEGGLLAVVDEAACDRCGECAEACRFGAVVSPGEVDALACDGCSACAHRCPARAISMRPVVTGDWYESETRFGPLYHARLRPGRESSGKLVTEIRTAAIARAERDRAGLVLVDGPPGIACPVIASVAGADLALIVTEPSVSGARDMERALAAVVHFGVPTLLVVNKADLGPEWTDRIEDYARDRQIETSPPIPFDTSLTRTMARREVATAVDGGPFAAGVRALWNRLVIRLTPPAPRPASPRPAC